MENPIKMDDLGVPLFLETPIYAPRHPVIPPEVRCLIGMFLGSSHTFSGGGPGCLGYHKTILGGSSQDL